MKINQFGKTDLKVSEIGFGGSRIGGVFAKGGDGEALTVLRKSLDAGITFYDTSDLYAHGASEALIGKAFRGRRDQVIIATKGGYRLPAQRTFVRRIKPIVRPVIHALGLKRASIPSSVSGAVSQEFSPDYLGQAVEASLKRLQTDHIDLYQLHNPPAKLIHSDAFTETLQALEKLKQQGKLRFYGVSTDTFEDLSPLLSAPGISSIQFGFGLLDLEALNHGILARAEARGLGVIARGCFGGGFLKDGPDVDQLKATTSKWQRILSLRALSSELGRPLLETALQFCRAAPGISVTVLGMHTQDHLRENLLYAQATPLTAKEFHTLSHEPQTAGT